MNVQQRGNRALLARILAEFLGTAAVVATVLGAGFMTAQLAAHPALALTMIALAVGAVLFVSIATLGPISGAHFNPIVSLAQLARKSLTAKEAAGYLVFQLLGALAGALVANLMFKQAFEISKVSRISTGTFIGEVVASAGLVLLILLLINFGKQNLIAAGVALWIVAGHLFTSSTSFANPAVTIGRVFSASPSSIEFQSALWFVLAQLLGLVLALVFSKILIRERR